MDVDIAVLGGGPGGYTAAIRAAQLAARVACIDRAPELGGTCLRIGCIPTKAWVQTALALKQAEETFGKLGVKLDASHLDFPAANEWKAAVVKRMTGAWRSCSRPTASSGSGGRERSRTHTRSPWTASRR